MYFWESHLSNDRIALLHFSLIQQYQARLRQMVSRALIGSVTDVTTTHPWHGNWPMRNGTPSTDFRPPGQYSRNARTATAIALVARARCSWNPPAPGPDSPDRQRAVHR